MTQQEIMAMSVEEVYRRVAETLWPKVPVAPLTAHEVLPCWNGVGRMVEAMRERDFAVAMTVTFKDCEVYFIHKRKAIIHKTGITHAPVIWEAVARACLLALTESEDAK